MKLIIALSVFLISNTTFAEEPEIADGPCNKLIEVCKNYIKTSKTKKSLYRDCMQPLLSEKKIEGLNVNSDDLEACRAKKAELKQKK
jgi:hypothetical protein